MSPRKAQRECSVEGSSELFTFRAFDNLGEPTSIVGSTVFLRVRYEQGGKKDFAMTIVDGPGGVAQFTLLPADNIAGLHCVEFVWTNASGFVEVLPLRAIEYDVRPRA